MAGHSLSGLVKRNTLWLLNQQIMGGDVVHYTEGSGETAWYFLTLAPVSHISQQHLSRRSGAVGPAVQPHLWPPNISLIRREESQTRRSSSGKDPPCSNPTEAAYDIRCANSPTGTELAARDLALQTGLMELIFCWHFLEWVDEKHRSMLATTYWTVLVPVVAVQIQMCYSCIQIT